MRRTALLALAGALALTVSACGSEETAQPPSSQSPASPSPSGQSASSAETSEASTGTGTEDSTGSGTGAESSSDAVVVQVSIEGDQVDPSGERVEVRAGQPIEFVVDSDSAGEMHVHSTPEHTIAIEPGTTEQTITLDRPGVVEVELHDPEVVVVQLEVR